MGTAPSDPPAQRPCSATQLRVSCCINIILRVPCRRGSHTLTQVWGLYAFSFWLIFTYLMSKLKSIESFLTSNSRLWKFNPEWPILTSLLLVTGCDVLGFPFSWKLKAKFPFQIFVFIFLSHSTPSLMSWPSLVQISTHYLTWLNKAGFIK